MDQEDLFVIIVIILVVVLMKITSYRKTYEIEKILEKEKKLRYEGLSFDKYNAMCYFKMLNTSHNSY